MQFTAVHQEGLTYHTADGFTAVGGVAHAFSTRMGGVSEGMYSSLNLGANRGDDPKHVRENYRRFCAALGVQPERLVFSRQVHADGVRTVTCADIGKGLDREIDYEADALMTDIPGIVLTVFTADCLPILLYDPVRRAVAAVHAGWRGTALDIAGRAAARMGEVYGSDPKDILAAVGPCIAKCCFETGADVPNAMTEVLGSAALPYIASQPAGKFHVDLKGINTCLLERAGLQAAHISISNACTSCRPDEFWSHRVTQGQRGSQAAVIALDGCA
ncbi:MAG: peptidoglycan editing factor PgeF [Oscillospiraceae bacterium]|nr:peptidoglycan editing factor PgeF [Oscillospiraceae bacterium]